MVVLSLGMVIFSFLPSFRHTNLCGQFRNFVDVLLHILIGQTLEGGLVALGGLAGDGHNLVGEVVLTNLLELFILRSAELGGSSSEGLGQLDGTILSIDGDSSHGDYLFLSDSLGVCLFVSEGVVPFVVITLYDMELMNLSLFLYWFMFLKKFKRKRG